MVVEDVRIFTGILLSELVPAAAYPLYSLAKRTFICCGRKHSECSGGIFYAVTETGEKRARQTIFIPHITDNWIRRTEVSARHAPGNSRRSRRWLQKYRFVAPLAGCLLLVVLATVLVNLFEWQGNGGELIWAGNGILLAYLLLAPRWRWPAYLLTGFLALALGSAIVHETWRVNLLYNVLDIAEVLIAALLMRRRSAELPRFTDLSYLFRFIGFAVLAAPIAVGLVYALISQSWTHVPVQYALLRWAGADGLGIAVLTPTFVAISRSNFSARNEWRQGGLYLALTAVVAIAAFCQDKVPLLFLIYPLLVIGALRVDQGWAAFSLLEITAAGSWFTTRGHGPLAAVGFTNQAGPIFHLQLFVITGMFMLYGISVVLERQKVTERKLREIVSLHKLVTENSRDVIILADFNGRRSYVSKAAESMGGWTTEEILAHRSLELLHPQDLPKAEEVVRKLRSGAEGGMIEIRVQKKNGAYLWVKAALRVVRDSATGIPIGILNTVRDISERKRAEQQLEEAYRTVEALALTDGLTGLANRRHFDQYLSSEWRRAMRERQPLSILMIDADFFKPYNDTYGHTRGDSCLKQIAEACQDVAARPGDLVARFGGEEFVVILPNTTCEGARQVAEEICEAVRLRRLPHRGNQPEIVTVSVGCATTVPQFGRHSLDLIERADEALYKAKQHGRNQVYSSDTMNQSYKCGQGCAQPGSSKKKM
jgi:diguanylate cyclase (GGDEF)-like protein/PAS domain S-box-containing protein